jgi:O-succinylbenzoic acid--CoA ligase
MNHPAPFLIADERSLSWSEAERLAGVIAAWAPDGALVGIRMESAFDTAAAVAACWLSGRAFTVHPFAVMPDRELTEWPDLSPVPVPDRFDPESVYAILSTSGTSGVPKRVPLKRRQMIAATSAAAALRPGPGGAWLLPLPLSHIGGIAVVLRSLLFGTSVRIGDADLIGSDPRVETASMVATQLHRLLSDPDFRCHPGFRRILLGGGRIPEPMLQTCRERGIPVVPSFGMTETNAQIIGVPPALWRDVPPHSCGRVLAPNEARIRNGILQVKGPQLPDPERWFDTGDHARMDADGWITIETRRTDRIVTGGENVDPEGVEDALRALPGIRDAAVIGLPDDEWGQIVAAVIVADEGRTDESVIRQLKAVLPAHQVPKRIIRADSLPKTENGKLRRAELRDRLSRPA